MLSLSFRFGERLRIRTKGEDGLPVDCWITVIPGKKPKTVKMIFDAPLDVEIMREKMTVMTGTHPEQERRGGAA